MPKRLRALILPLSMMFAPTMPKALADEGFEVINVGQAPAAEVAALVERALTIQGQQAEVVVDAPRNRLLVRGTKPAQERVRELVATLARQSGQPNSSSDPGAPGWRRGENSSSDTPWRRSPSPKATAPPSRSAGATLSPPRNIGPASRRITVPVVQPSTGEAGRPFPSRSAAATLVPQTVVQANVATRPTANVQTSYTEELPLRTQQPKAPASPPPGPPASANQPRPKPKPVWPYQEMRELVARPAEKGGQTILETRAVKLRHLSAEALPDKLKEAIGARLRPLASTSENVTSFVVQTAGQRPLEIYIEKETNQAVLRGPEEANRQMVRLIAALDSPPDAANQRTRVVSLRGKSSPFVQRALAAVALSEDGPAKKAAGAPLMARLFQAKRGDDAADQADGAQGAQSGPAENEPPREGGAAAKQSGDESPRSMQPEEDDADGALSGNVEIEEIPELGAIIVRGSQRDVERVMKIIEEVERLSAETEPVIELYPLKHISSEAMADVVEPLYGDELAPRQGRVSITPLVHPNALLLIGRAENIKAVSELISRLDQPGGPASQFEVFHLRHATAASAATTLSNTFGTFSAGLGVRVRATADARTNALIVQAGPRDLLEVAKLLKELDSPGSASVNELRLFRLRYASAIDVANLLNAAVQRNPQQGPQQGQQPQQGGFGQQPRQPQAQMQQQPQQQLQQGAPQGQQQQQQAQGQAQGQQQQETKAVMLRLLTVDAKGNKQLSMGHLGDTRISADVKSNTVVVSAPAESLDLIAALISQLDVANAVPAQIKVFTLTNGDATNMVTMLEDLFQISGTSMAVNGPQALGPQVSAEEGATVPLRFSVDARTNSIIASGSASDLLVVEAILLRLDDSDVRERRSVVYKLKNAPALDVAVALNEYLQKERQTQQTAPGLLSSFEKIEREVVVVPELVTNSLIVSATPRFFDEIARIVEQLDARAPMVMIQVLIAEVTLNNTDEFGVELGFQNAVMFDRSLLSGLQLTTSSTNNIITGGAGVSTQTQNVVAANNTPGFDFNNPTLQGATASTTTAGGTTSPSTFGIGLPNSGSASSLATAGVTGAQALSNFGMGRVNSNLGYGGLALSLSSEFVNVLLRALRERDRLDVLSRPQIMTLDNQPAYIVVGQRVPLLQGTSLGLAGANSLVQFQPVGLIVAVTPRITRDGLVVMEIDTEKSLLAPLTEGIPVGFGALGQVLRQPIINVTQAQTTISAMDGQTVVFGGMITQSSQVIQRRVPGLSEIPLLGRLFRYDFQNGKKTELIVIMTPHIVRNEADVERLKRVEAGRMSWCLSDVQKVHGDGGLRNRSDEWLDKEIPTVYPDMDPIGSATIDLQPGAEPVPAPPGMLPTPAAPPKTPSPKTPWLKMRPFGAGRAPHPAKQAGTGPQTAPNRNPPAAPTGGNPVTARMPSPPRSPQSSRRHAPSGAVPQLRVETPSEEER